MTFDLTTFVFELVNFIVLAFVLGRFVYRPIASAIRERRDEIAQTKQQANERLALVDSRQTELDARSTELDRLREQVFAEATAEAAAERARLMAEAREDARSERARVQAMLEHERDAALEWVREVAVDRGVEVAGYLLLDLVPDEAHDALVRRLLTSLTERAPSLIEPDAAEPVPVEVAFAKLPGDDSSEALREGLEQALGLRVRLTLAEDEALGAGAVVRVGDRVLDASIRGQLDLLRDQARQHLESA